MNELIDRFEAAFSGRDEAAFAAICAADLHYEDPLTARPLESPVELGRHAARLWAAFPDARVERAGERLTDPSGRLVAAPTKVLGTHRGGTDELPATNRFINVAAIFYCELDATGERLWRVRTFFDLYGGAVQLGVLPRPGTLGEKALLALRGFGVRAGRQ